MNTNTKIKAMKFWLYLIFLTNWIESKLIMKNTFSNTDSRVFKLIDNSMDAPLPKFVLAPLYNNLNESVKIEYKSFIKSSTLVLSSEWILSIYVDRHFFNINQLNEPLHVMCFVQFNIIRSSNDIGKNASCKITIRANNYTAVSNCSINLGRPPGICTAAINLSDTNFVNSTPIWATISAELSFTSTEIIATSINNASIVFNGIKPVNWTIVHEDQLFGKFALGLPLESVKIDSSFIMPISISEIDDVQTVRILIEYQKCLQINSVEITNKSRWNVMTKFENSDNKDSGAIRFVSRNPNRDNEYKSSSSFPELAFINFTVVNNNQQQGDCLVKAAISKVELFSGKVEKYFNKDMLQQHRHEVSVPIDLAMVTMIVFQKPTNVPVQLFSRTPSTNETQIYTYMLIKSNEHYSRNLIKIVTCVNNKFTQGIPDRDCKPKQIENSWVLPIEILHWKTVVFNIFNVWQPESWTLNLSDIELNPITNWQVNRNGKCVIFYQSALLRIGVRLSKLNSFGINTYLGSNLINEKPWIDLSMETDLSRIKSYPSNAVKLSRNKKGSIIVTGNLNQSIKLNLLDRQNKVLADTEVSVFRNHWASVMKFIGRCVSDFNIQRTESHPNTESEFINFEVTLKPLRIGEKCHLFLGVGFNDNSQLMLEDLDPNDYRLEVNGIEFKNGNVVTFLPRMKIILYESPNCVESRIVYNAYVDLSRDSVEESTTMYSDTMTSIINEKIETSTTKPTVITTAYIDDRRNSLTIAIYCIVGVVGMALMILILNCIIGLSVRQHSISNIQRRLSKSCHFNSKTVRKDNMSNQLPNQELYPPLLPPPGPIIPPNKQPTEWAVSSESGIGLERSSLGSQQDPIALSTFRVSIANGSVHPSDSSSYIHQTSPYNDVILESNNIYTAEHCPQIFDTPSCLNQSYWSGINSSYRLTDNATPSIDYRANHDYMKIKEYRNNNTDLV